VSEPKVDKERSRKRRKDFLATSLTSEAGFAGAAKGEDEAGAVTKTVGRP